MNKFNLIGEITEENIAAAIDFLKANAKEEAVTIYIDSPGGEVFAGLQLFRAMDNFEGKIIAELGVMAASMAAFIALNCDEIHATRDTFLMVHQAYCSATGTAAEFRSTADLLEQASSRLSEIVASKAKDAEKVAEYMATDTWFGADALLEAFNAVTIVDENRYNKQIAASYASLRNLPAALLALEEDEPEKEEEKDEPEAEEEDNHEEPEEEEPQALVDNAYALDVLAKAKKYL